jgi:hypothetical protein
VAHTSNPNYSGGRNQDDCGSKPFPGKVCETLSQKYPTQKRTSGVALVVEHQPSKYESLCVQTPVPKNQKAIFDPFELILVLVRDRGLVSVFYM